MKPSKNAFLGYTYQQSIAFLLLTKMDVERQIEMMEIEADVNNNFDDIKTTISNETIYCQIKDFDDVKIDDLIIEKEQIRIKDKTHKLSDKTNVLFFKDIGIKCNDRFLGLSAYKLQNVYIISLSRSESINKIENLYKNNGKRASVINQFFNKRLDKRRLLIKREELPTIDTFNVHLLEKTVKVGKNLLEFESILFIEGKPGVGKSHLVTCLEEEYKDPLIYRFWISNQDKDYNSRLYFKNFLNDISKKLFHDYLFHSEKEIIEYIIGKDKTVIIDGLDHVENYQNEELEYFISFIDKLKGKCKTIVLSRPLKKDIKWKKQQLVNWNFKETKFVLEKLYHISDYLVCKNIFETTDGYPILVRFITEQYKHNGEIVSLGKLKDTNDYYEKIISNVNTKSALTVFISTRSFLMESEFSKFLEDELFQIVNEFIKSYPHLFEIKLNRISLFHDSLNTYLRNTDIDYSKRLSKVKRIVYKSLMSGESRFMSRVAFFDLDKQMRVDIIKKFAKMDSFVNIVGKCFDFEAIRVFYKQIREFLPEMKAEEFDIYTFYDLSLITNILARDHFSTDDEFLYTYVKSLLSNGYNDDDITSSEYLFGMYYYYKTKDATILYNLMSDAHYDTEYFYHNLEWKVWMEENYFKRHEKPQKKTEQLKRFLNKRIIHEPYIYVPHLLANLYLHNTNIKELKGVQEAVKTYFNKDENLGLSNLKNALSVFDNTSAYLSKSYLDKAKDIISSLGKDIFSNEYHINSLKELVFNNGSQGSFSVSIKVHNYIRLSLYENRKIDLPHIGYFFAMYYNRKDMTVINIDDALKVFEDKGFIKTEEAIEIIVKTQNMSEKGIRHLLTAYIELHEPAIILTILKEYHLDHLEITWFDLSEKFINHFPDKLFNYAMNEQLLRRKSQSKIIDFKDIENVFRSNRKLNLIQGLNSWRYQIRIDEGHPSIEELNKLECLIATIKPDKKNEYVQNAEERFTQGVLDCDSIDFIKEKGLKITDIAGYTDDYYAVFSELDIFETYDKEEVKENVLPILRNALIGKTETLNRYASLYYMPGNIPKFMDNYNVDIEFDRLYDSFMKYLYLSQLYTLNL